MRGKRKKFKASKKVSSIVIKAIRDEIKGLNKGIIGNYLDSDFAMFQIQGLSHLANKLGIDCGCVLRPSKGIQCSCYTRYGKKIRKMTLSD